ncbi:pentapeptide repeat-containing protein [Micromonospora krabiensis]|uniref:Pentapeptide repeat-containing protein n=1 Tax=Micromonospora krabiensis TaxID=307121 RepID=A0A1C3N955_9ACTN|nr:pentapeptide repeat-containing protein [Micromonospora krabiensis]SBV29109.1 Pentapeptide repeat-containing protein [Micromonospora krabiensis]
MNSYQRTAADVARWPDDPAAREALEEWFAAVRSDSTACLSGDFLDFRGADLSRLDLTGAYLASSRLVGVRFEDANLGDANLDNSELRGADFSFADLAKAEMVGCSAENARFRSARLLSVQFDEAVLAGADLSHAILNSATFYKTDLRDANLEHASLRWCTLGGRTMPAVLTGARMVGGQFEGAKGAVVGPVFVDEGAARSLAGAELEAWFAEHGAESVQVVG